MLQIKCDKKHPFKVHPMHASQWQNTNIGLQNTRTICLFSEQFFKTSEYGNALDKLTRLLTLFYHSPPVITSFALRRIMFKMCLTEIQYLIVVHCNEQKSELSVRPA